jgi:hypothetical protein
LADRFSVAAGAGEAVGVKERVARIFLKDAPAGSASQTRSAAITAARASSIAQKSAAARCCRAWNSPTGRPELAPFLQP